MAVKYLIDQDKEKCYQVNFLGIHPMETECGYKLLMDMTATADNPNYLPPEDCADLGTFDKLDEVTEEILAIATNKDEIHIVGGYSNGGFAKW